ncbi:MAG: 50S ribosomal protein L9 [Rickettsiales bacterium]|jgi:large subunit ribosomal protein L9|nr:50S ribosomal protein L9 [Rickettsiales bacterium]
MKIILKTKIRKLGDIGDVVDVKDGYGKNLLIPNGFALFYTDKNYEYFKQRKVELEKQNSENKAAAEDIKNKINTREIVLIENAGDDGKLYGSISGAKIATYLNDLLKLQLKKTNISVNETIKEVGKYIVDVELHPEVFFEKEIIVARTKEEAIKIKKGEKVVVKKDDEAKKEEVKEEVTKKAE